MKIIAGHSQTMIIFDYLCTAFTNVGATYWKRLASFHRSESRHLTWIME